MLVRADAFLASAPQLEPNLDYHRELGIFELIEVGKSILEKANSIDIQSGSVRVRYSKYLDSYYEKLALEATARLMLGTANTVREFPQINEVTGINDWSHLTSHSLDLVIPNKVREQGREAVAELLSRRITNRADVQHSPVLATAMKKMLRDGFSYKIPSGRFADEEFSRFQAECNQVVKFLLSDIASVDETMSLKTTSELLNQALVKSLKGLRPEVLMEAFNAAIDNVHSVAPIVSRETRGAVDDSLNNMVNMFENRLQLYQFAVTDDLPSRYFEA